MVASSAQTDCDILNDSAKYAFDASDSIYAYDDSTINNSLGFNSPGTGEFGNVFEIFNLDTMTSGTFQLENPIQGATVRLLVYHFIDSTQMPGAIIDSTRSFIVGKNGTGWYTLQFGCNGIIAQPGKYLVTIEQSNPVRMNLGIDGVTGTGVAGTRWARATGGSWGDLYAQAAPAVKNAVLALRVNLGDLSDNDLLPNTSLICNNSSSYLKLNTKYDRQVWSNGLLFDSILVSTPGVYKVTAWDEIGCMFTDSTTATMAQITQFDTAICKGDTLELGNLQTNNYTYQWSTNDTTISIKVSPSQTSTYYVTISDGVGSCKDSITIAVSEPIVNATVVNTASCANSTDGSLTASVSKGLSPYTYKWSNGDSLASSSGIRVGTYNVTVTDSIGCIALDTISMTYNDSIQPTANIQNITVYLDTNGTSLITTTQVNDSSFDNCGLDTMYLNNYSFNCSDTGSNTVILTVKDVNGNLSTANATITVLDTISPKAISQNFTVYLDANGAASITTVQVNDSSYDNCTLDTLYLNDYSFSCSDKGSNTVILTVKDVNGNSSTSNATIMVLDTISPTAIAQNITVYLDANGTASITAVQANNGSSDNCQVGLTLSKSIITCEDEGNIMLALIARDSSGNTSIDSFSVQVIDTNFTVASILGDSVSAQGNINTYSVSSINGATYQWSAVNGISVANGSSSDITWSKDSVQGVVQVIQTVKEGCKDTSSMLVTLWVTGIKDIQLIENINLFPNPTRDRVFISVDRGEISNATILVYSGLGQLVIQHKDVQINNSAFELDLGQLLIGQYTVVISSGEKSNRYRVILH